MGQITSQIYTKSATYDFNLDGPSTIAGVNMGIVLNPGEFVMNGFWKVLQPFSSPNPADTFGVGISGPGIIGGTIVLFQPRTTAQLNTLLGTWRTMQWASQPADFGAFCPQPTAPQGTPSNTYFMLFGGLNPNTAGSLAICVTVGSTAL